MPESRQLDNTLVSAPASTGSGSRSVAVEHVGGSGIYPASGPHPAGPAELRGQGELAHPEERHRQAVLAAPHFDAGAIPLLIGRAVFGGFFLYNGINHFRNRKMMADYTRSKNVPAAETAVAATGAMLAAGGLSLITGVRPKIGASLIAGFLAGVSPLMHAFWREQDPQQKMNETVNFSKNMALLGAAMLSTAIPEPWPYSLTRS